MRIENVASDPQKICIKSTTSNKYLKGTKYVHYVGDYHFEFTGTSCGVEEAFALTT